MSANRRTMTSAELQAEVLAKIKQFSEPNRPLAKRVHELIMEAAPALHPRLWYGMPGYANTKDSTVLIFFREDEKYMTLGLTEGVTMEPATDAPDKLMPCAWFLTELDTATEQRIAEIVRSVATG